MAPSLQPDLARGQTAAAGATRRSVAVRQMRVARANPASRSSRPQPLRVAQLGSTAPLLPASSPVFRDLVVAIDEHSSHSAVRWTLDHLYREGDCLHLLHVVPSVTSIAPPSGLSLAGVLPPQEGEQEALASHALGWIEANLLSLARARGANVAVDLVHGRCNQAVADTICGKVDELAAAVVVLSVARRRGLLESWLQTSVNEQVAARCSRPTLIFHE